ncbi:glucosidase 2 subunit beta [Zeugodacus cucurbitae]|uniref:Glucosidase 2 subunit beta n=1 Tax=Zeugodacus cucurbitae TaxID=28588 RepID=A0A0A1XJ19_ZEUCU|nr:glucosidase 2 subunit beta [Zeugodacus cucurbitae]
MRGMYRLASLNNLLLQLVLAVIVTLSVADVPRPIGVPLYKASLYTPRSDESWVCLDGKNTIRHTQINDDFCDCEDGSDEPGTSACSNGIFNCENVGFRQEDIQSTRVNDGICDCCDGSDEYTDSANKCPNTCLELGRAEEEIKRSQADLHKRGSEIRAELISKGKQMRTEREARRKVLQQRRNEQEAVKAEKEELKRNAEAAEAEALEIYKEQQREKDAAAAEAAKSQEDTQTMRYEAEAAFIKYDTNKDGFVEVTELMVDMTLDRDRNGIVTVEEAKYFLDERDRIDLDSFFDLSWPRIKPIKMLAEGIFKPPTPEGDEHSEQESIEAEGETAATVEGSDQFSNEEGREHEGAYGEEDLYEDEDGEADVGVGTVSDETHPEPEYDPETKRLIDLANEARNAYSDAEQKVREIDNEIKDIEDQTTKDYGLYEEYAALDGECFTFEEREYLYTLCPFDRASQKQRSSGSETNLGRYEQWNGDGDKKYEKQKYAHGTACWNGPQRTTIVDFKCGLEHKIISVTEPNRCEYNYLFETPAACDGVVAEDIRQRDEL